MLPWNVIHHKKLWPNITFIVCSSDNHRWPRQILSQQSKSRVPTTASLSNYITHRAQIIWLSKLCKRKY